MQDPIPEKYRPKIKDVFEEKYKKLLGDRYEEFMKYSFLYAKKAIRVNTLKATPENIQKRLEDTWKLTPVPWCKEGFWIEHKTEDRFDVGNIPEHQMGYFYVQDPASMMPAIVLNPQPGEKVLDMCAAPGSKTTQMAMYMQNKGVLVANDIQGRRLASLGINLQRCGVSNTIITKQQGNYYRKLDFDRILVDAPCSGTGTIRRSLKTMKMYSPNLVSRMANIQRQLIKAGFMGLKPGGTMVYSTCTQGPEENEAVVTHLLREFDNAELLPVELNIKKSPVVTEFEDLDINPEVKKCLRIYPQDNDTEGFFVSKIQKKPQ